MNVLPTRLFKTEWPTVKIAKVDKKLTGQSGETLVVRGMWAVKIERGKYECLVKCMLQMVS